MSKFFGKKRLKPVPARPKQEVLQEYTQVCGFVGDRKFKIAAAEREVAQFMNRLDSLSREMDKILAEERAEAEKAQPEVKSENQS